MTSPLPPFLQAVKSNPEDVSDLLPLLEMVRTEVLYQVCSGGGGSGGGGEGQLLLQMSGGLRGNPQVWELLAFLPSRTKTKCLQRLPLWPGVMESHFSVTST